MIEGACASLEPITEKIATAVMKAIGYGKQNREDFRRYFRCDEGPVADVTLRVERAPGGPDAQWTDSATLLRILHCIEGLHVTDGCPYPSDAVKFTELSRHDRLWSPFLGCSWGPISEREGKLASTCTLVLDASRAQGMEVGKTWTSSALTSVEQGG